MQLKCCGGEGPSDYGLNLIPTSCCRDQNVTAAPCILYEDGCVSKFMEFLQTSVNVVGYVVIGTAAVEVNLVKFFKKHLCNFLSSRFSALFSHFAYLAPSGTSPEGRITLKNCPNVNSFLLYFCMCNSNCSLMFI